MSITPGRRPARRLTRVLLLVLIVVVVVVVVAASVIVEARRASRSASPITSTTQLHATMDRMVPVLEELLGAMSARNPAHLAAELGTIRPAALAHAAWPDADYALLDPEVSEGPEERALGAIVWSSSSTDSTDRDDADRSWAAHCMFLQIDQQEARIAWQEVQCPQETPGQPSSASSPEDPAVTLERPELRTGTAFRSPDGTSQGSSSDPIRRGSPTGGLVPTDRPPAMGDCGPEALRAVLDSASGAGPADSIILRIQNISPNSCTLPTLSALRIERQGELVVPLLTQAGASLDLAPWESAATFLEFRPHQISPDGDALTLTLGGIDVALADPSDLALRVRDGDEMTAEPWQRAGYGVLLGTDENWREDLDIAPPCVAEQLAVTTGAPRSSSSGDADGLPEPAPFTLLNISTAGCRIEAGTLAGIPAVPALIVPSTALLQSGHSLDLLGPDNAPNLTGQLIVDGIAHSVTPQQTP